MISARERPWRISPTESSDLTSRHLLKEHGLGEQISESVKAHLSARGMTIRRGTIVEATLIAAPSSTKNKTGQRDPELHQSKTGNQWYQGIKVPIGVDKDSGLIHSVAARAANVHDLTPVADLLHGEESVVYADTGYQGIAKRPEMAGKTAEFQIAMRPGNRRILPDMTDGKLLDLVEAAKAHIRAKVEHPFRVIKPQFGFHKTRLRGMSKNRCKVNELAALLNLFLTRRQLLVPDKMTKWCAEK